MAKLCDDLEKRKAVAPDESALLRLINTGFKRFSADPSSRVASTRLMLIAAASLHASYANDDEAHQTITQVLDAMGYGQ